MNEQVIEQAKRQVRMEELLEIVGEVARRADDLIEVHEDGTIRIHVEIPISGRGIRGNRVSVAHEGKVNVIGLDERERLRG